MPTRLLRAPARTATATAVPQLRQTAGRHRTPVFADLVATLNRPGANLTGITALAAELAPKQLQLLRELIPDAALLGALADPAFPGTQFIIADLQAAARTLSLQVVVVNARTDSDLEMAFATFSQQHVSGVLVTPGTFYLRHTEQLAELTARHALPAMALSDVSVHIRMQDPLVGWTTTTTARSCGHCPLGERKKKLTKMLACGVPARQQDGAGGHRVKATECTLSIRSVSRLDQGQEPGQPGDAARTGRHVVT